MQKLLALLLFFGGFALGAQNVDSAKVVALGPEQPERERIQALDILGDVFLGDPADSMLKYASLYRDLANQTGLSLDRGMADLLFAVYYTQIGDTLNIRQAVHRGVDLCLEAEASEKAIIHKTLESVIYIPTFL